MDHTAADRMLRRMHVPRLRSAYRLSCLRAAWRRTDAPHAHHLQSNTQRIPATRFWSGALGLLLALVMTDPGAQNFAFEWNPRTGDAWVDEALTGMNGYGGRYRGSFVDELARYHAAPRELVSDLLERQRWAPGDVYFACAVAQVLGRPCRVVVQEWQRAQADGWEALVRQLGVEPRTDAFDRIKRGIVHSYDRWNRPIELDDELQRAFAERSKQRPYRWTPPQPDKPGRAQSPRKP